MVLEKVVLVSNVDSFDLQFESAKEVNDRVHHWRLLELALGLLRLFFLCLLNLDLQLLKLGSLFLC